MSVTRFDDVTVSSDGLSEVRWRGQPGGAFPGADREAEPFDHGQAEADAHA